MRSKANETISTIRDKKRDTITNQIQNKNLSPEI